MEKYIIEKDIPVFYVQASSFPEGVMAAHKALHAETGAAGNRRFFGISYADNTGKIIYKAAAEEMYEGEAKLLQFEGFVIQSGNYMAEYVPDFCADVQLVGKAFQALLKTPNIDPEGYCLEMYESDRDVRCLVPLRSEQPVGNVR